MKGKLHWKLTVIFCLSVFLGFLLGYFYFTAHLRSFLEQDLQNNLKREIILSKRFIEAHIDAHHTVEAPQVLAHQIGADLGVEAMIISADGVVLGDSQLSQDELSKAENYAGHQEVKDAWHAGFGVSRRYSNELKKYVFYIAIPFRGQHALGILRFAQPFPDVDFIDTGLGKMIIFSLFLVFLLSIGFTYLMTRIVSQPLREMASIAKAMADGDFSKKPSVRGHDEVGELAMAITHMSQQICNKINDVEGEKAKIDAVLASMFEGIMVVDEKGVVLLMNPSLRKLFFIDISPEGRRAVEIIRNSVVADMADKLLKGAERFISQEILIAFPEEKMLKVNGVVIRALDKLEGAVFVFHDITELRRLEKMRQDFVANVSHELRTPVASIKGYAETLLQGAMDDKAALKEFLNTIYQNSDRLVNLINDLLDLARIQSGRMNITPVAIAVEPVIHRCLSILEKTVQDKALTVHVQMPEGIPLVMADEARLSQVVLNLLDNAVKYTTDGGNITIKAVAGEKMVQFDVIDNGIGIPEEDLPRIFERFYRVDKSRSRDLGGTGLGLSIVKHIVYVHGGEVWASSILGQGTTFSFTLPRV